MPQVNVTGPYNDTPADADEMRSILSELAFGINSVDGSQLANGSVSIDKIVDESVTLAKLRGGHFVYYAKFLDEDAVAPTQDIMFTGVAGDYGAPKFTHNVWQAVRTGRFRFRNLDGSTFAITPPQNCWAIFIGGMRALYQKPSAGSLTQAYLSVWDEAAGAVTNVAYHLVESQTDELNDTSTIQKFIVLGIVPVTGGVTIKPQPAMKLVMSAGGTTTMEGRVFVDPKNTWFGCFLLPR
jgi:hypothetical protein